MNSEYHWVDSLPVKVASVKGIEVSSGLLISEVSQAYLGLVTLSRYDPKKGPTRDIDAGNMFLLMNAQIIYGESLTVSAGYSSDGDRSNAERVVNDLVGMIQDPFLHERLLRFNSTYSRGARPA